jgi:hypothetical protein
MLFTGTRMSLGDKLLRGAAAVAVAATAMTVLSPVAEAASAPSAAAGSRTVFVIPAGGTVSTTAGGAHIKIVGSATIAATCTLNVFNPFRYYGGPWVGGGEEGTANIQCNVAVSQLFIEVALYKNNTQVTYNSNTAYSNSLVVVDTEYPVSAGYYITGAQGTVTANGTTSSLPFKTSSSVYLS